MEMKVIFSKERVGQNQLLSIKGENVFIWGGSPYPQPKTCKFAYRICITKTLQVNKPCEQTQQESIAYIIMVEKTLEAYIYCSVWSFKSLCRNEFIDDRTGKYSIRDCIYLVPKKL